MYIKEVQITGLRSYRETTIINDFSQKHNVVVGRNGSGKSNFFFAIQFVLSDEFTHLTAERRLGLLHEGTGPRPTSARVEIVFDNSDRRLVANESNEVRIMRQVAHKKDVYYIDGKMVQRSEIVNLMESAGFSRSNPYYIVRQGKINELATAPDKQRLALLREIAGTRVYDDRKEESLKILKDTKNKTEKIESLLAYIDDRLKSLENEKDDLKEYEKWDKMKRSVEYTIYELEKKEAVKKLDKLAQQREEMSERQNKVATELVEVNNRGNQVAADQRRLEARFKGMKEEKEALEAEQASRYEKKTELELKCRDLKEDVERERNGRTRAESTLNQLLHDIDEKEKELASITPTFQALVEKESALASDMRIAETRCKELYAKQGHGQQFKSAQDRDNFLQKDIKQLNHQIKDMEAQQKDIEKSLEEDKEEEARITAEVHNLQMESDENCVALEKENQKHLKLSSEYQAAMMQNNEAEREVRSIRDNFDAISHDIQQNEQQMRQLGSRSIMFGVRSVETVLSHMRQRGDAESMECVNGYYGILLDLINCDNTYYTAVETTAGNRLYNHVVATDRIAMKLLKEINKNNLQGEVNFFPINRVAAPSARDISDENSQDARTMLSVLDYDPKFDVVFRSVFATTAIIRKMEVGPRVCKHDGFDCVTLEGDQISRKGTWSGGYVDSKKSKLELRELRTTLSEQRQQIENSLKEAQRKLEQKQQELRQMAAEMNKVMNSNAEKKHVHRDLTEKRKYLNEQLVQLQRRRQPKENQVITTKNRIREMIAQRQSIEAELGTPLQSQLTTDERAQCEDLQKEIKEKKRELEQVSKERNALESRKHKLENQLETNLKRKREELNSKIHDISIEEKRHNLDAENAERKAVNDRLAEISVRIKELDESLQEYQDQSEALTRSADDVQEQQKDLEAQLAEFSKQADQICTKQSTLQTAREEALKKIRELGTLPTEAFTKYVSLSAKQLDKKLSECTNELKKYENVNKKALDQYVQAAEKKAELTKRLEEQKTAEDSITNLLTVLENRKYDAITLTFKQVSKNFKEVFRKLVPAGDGELVMKSNVSADMSMSSQESEDTQRKAGATVDDFEGVSIRVSFSGQMETREMQQLSGGQKSLVALALIFAIQKCDPAPFYLFDEIDAALDAQHRKAVADMIHELSDKAQFITTTFRPEMLEHAEKCYGVIFRNKVSHIELIGKDRAYDFVEDDQTHG